MMSSESSEEKFKDQGSACFVVTKRRPEPEHLDPVVRQPSQPSGIAAQQGRIKRIEHLTKHSYRKGYDICSFILLKIFIVREHNFG